MTDQGFQPRQSSSKAYASKCSQQQCLQNTQQQTRAAKGNKEPQENDVLNKATQSNQRFTSCDSAPTRQLNK